MDDPTQLQRDPYRHQDPDPWETVSPAGFGIRFLARLIDTVALTVGGGFIGGVFGVFAVVLQRAGAIGPGWQARVGHLGVRGFVMGLVGTVLYDAIAEWLGGATLGKLICGLRVARDDLGRPGFGATLVRNLAFFIDSFFFGLVAHSAMSRSRLQQRYGDRWARTIVIHRAGAPPAVVRTAGALALGIVGAWMVYATIAFASMIPTLF